MIGQEKLLTLINSLNSDTFPHVSMFVGESGSGKHTMINHIANNILKLNTLNITSNLTFEYIEELKYTPLSYIYIIDIDQIEDRTQNVILKFLEDYPVDSYIMLTCVKQSNVLDTVLNRLTVFNMDPYSKQNLLTFIGDDNNADMILNVCSTPGQILNVNKDQLSEIYKMCYLLVDKLSVVNYTNLLKIGTKLNYDKDNTKYDLEIFFKMIEYVILCKIKERPSELKLYNYYLTTKKYCDIITVNNYNKRHLVDNFLTNIWKEARQ